MRAEWGHQCTPTGIMKTNTRKHTHDDHKGTGPFPDTAAVAISREGSGRAPEEGLHGVPGWDVSKEHPVAAVHTTASQ